jgi:hypothetical protein
MLNIPLSSNPLYLYFSTVTGRMLNIPLSSNPLYLYFSTVTGRNLLHTIATHLA